MRKKSVKKLYIQLSKMNTQPNNTPVQNSNQTQVQPTNFSTTYNQIIRQQKRALIKAPCLGKIIDKP